MNHKTVNEFNITVVEPRGTGGMIHYAYQLCTALANEKVNVVLVTSKEYEMDNFPHNFSVNKLLRLWSSTEYSMESSPSTIHGKIIRQATKNMKRAQRGVRYIIEWIRLVKFLIKTKPDVVQFGKIEFPFEAIFLAILKRSGLKLTQICHEFELREQGHGILIRIINKFYQWVYDSFSIMFFHGESNKQRFSQVFKTNRSKFFVIPHGNEQLFLINTTINKSAQDLRRQYDIDKTAPVVLFFGNLMPSKGIPDLLTAFAQVNSEHKDVRLIVAGKPSKFIDLDSLMELAKNLGIMDATVFDTRYIPIEDVPPLMDMASVVVYPYLNSTQSGSLQVAYTFGRPVIATNVGGLPEAVEEGKSGFLVNPQSPNEIAEAILKFVENRNLTTEMGNYAKHLSMTRFSWETVAKEILKRYFLNPNR